MKKIIPYGALAFLLCLVFIKHHLQLSILKAAPPTDFQTNLIIGTGLTGPSSFKFAPDGRIFILQRTGEIFVYQNQQLTPFTTLPSAASGDRGLIGVAFDPNFLTNKYVYFYYTALPESGSSTGPFYNYLVRMDASTNTGSSPLILFDTEYTQTSSNELHVGGGILFGNDGKIYLGVGDNGHAPNGQDLSVPWGKILRINPDGSIPSDNPYVNIPNIEPRIWAYGLRNPWRLSKDSTNGEIFSADVGDASWEEINQIQKSQNYGWPIHEGYCLQDCQGFTDPLYAYSHDVNGQNLSSAVTLGPIYQGSMFPPEYQNSIFIADYARGFIQRLQFEYHDHLGQPHAHLENAYDFDVTAGSVVDMQLASDGSLYYLTYFPPRLYRITYDQENPAPVVTANADVLKGIEPLTVNFSSQGTHDPDNDPLTYQWDLGDTTTSTQPNPTHTYTQPGTYTVTLTVSDGTHQSQSIPIVIQVGTPPIVSLSVENWSNPSYNNPTPQTHADLYQRIESVFGYTPDPSAFYHAGDEIFFTSSGTDGAGFDLSDSDFSTEVIFHHDTHTHPFLGPNQGIKSNTFTIPVNGEHDPVTWFEIIVRATDQTGLTTTTSKEIFPVLSEYSIATTPINLPLLVDGISSTTPKTVNSVVGYQTQLLAPSRSTFGTDTYNFVSWQNNQPNPQTITTTLDPQTYTAEYQVVPKPFTANYFTNTNLSGEPILTRQEYNINFDWQNSSPDPNTIPLDNFSARFSTNIDFQPGIYQFNVYVDDGIRIIINDQVIYESWQGQVLQDQFEYTSQLSGNYPLVIEYVEFSGGSAIVVDWELVEPATPTPTPTPTQEPTDSFTAQYWNLSSTAVMPPTIPNTTPNLTRSEPEINHLWHSGSPDPSINNDKFVAQWQKQIQITQAGTYQFNTITDDGVRVYLNNQLLIDKWQDQASTSYNQTLYLPIGTYPLLVQYYEHGGGAIAQLNYQLLNTASPTPTPTPTLVPTTTPPTDTYVIQAWNLNTDLYQNQATYPNTSPDYTTQTQDIQYYWHDQFPFPNINADNFIIKATKIIAEPGNYTFTVTADDGIRVSANDQILIDQWQDQSATTYTTTTDLTEDTLLTIEYYEHNGGAIFAVEYQLNSNEPSPTPQPLPDNTSGFNLYYYNLPISQPIPANLDNLTPQHTEATTQTNLNFTWDSNPPLPGIQADKFAVQATHKHLTGGTYEFIVTADDGIRLWANDQLIIDQWLDQSATTYSATATVPDNWNLKIEYYENGGGAVLQSSFKQIDTNQPPPEPNLWQAKFWNAPGYLENPTIPTHTPDYLENYERINFTWESDAPATNINQDNYLAQFTKTQNFTPGQYQIKLRADDGVRFYLDGQLIVNEWQDQATTEFTTTLELNGEHTFVIEYYENYGQATLHFDLNPA